MAMETEKIEVYKCGFCGQLYRSKEQADECHQDRTCGECGVVIGKKSYRMLCDECKEKKWEAIRQNKIEEAEHMTYEMYQKEFPGYPIFWGDMIYFDLDDLYDQMLCNEAKLEDVDVWGTYEEKIAIDPEYIIENFEESCYFDYELPECGRNELENLIEKWNSEHGEDVYRPNKKIYIVLPDNFLDDDYE